MANTTQKQAARQFAMDWMGKGYEKGETQRFWLELLHNVFGIDNPMAWMQFELPVKTITKEKGSDFIDAYISVTKVLIEQKGSHVDLTAKAKQSDGAELTPYQQARRYATGLPLSMAPRWIVACNFTTFEVHDMEHPNDASEVIQLADLEKEYHRLAFLVDDSNAHVKRELEVSIKAGEIVGVLYDKILAQYKDPNNLESQKALNKLCVRLVFCLYAEDAGIFGNKNMFHDYMSQFSASDFRSKLIELFHVLDTKPEERDPYMDEKLAAFPYVNGGMFSGDIEIPRINEEIRELILQRASDDFDWSLISPTIFGAVFESTLNPATRRAGGMHYTSIENIHKVIDPLFLDKLKKELADIKAVTMTKTKRDKALAFQEKLASLKFLDPACGSGNFLTESYTSLRRLENEALRIIYGTDRIIGEMADPIKVSISQFYGIEINDFACAVAQTALWIAESQMMQETDEIVGFILDPLPLKRYANIREGNALRLDWSTWEEPDDLTTVYADEVYIHQYLPHESSSFIASEPEVKFGTIDLHSPTIHPFDKTKRSRYVKFDYIMGNPPFVGARIMSSEQKDDLISVFGAKWKNIGNMDYVTGWYKKTAELMMDNSRLHAALVSTNSITQGEQVANLWKPLMEAGVHIDFAWRTFVWDSESNHKAHVHCVIVGFSVGHSDRTRIIYDGNSVCEAKNINGYLIDYDNVFVESRRHPLCDVPEIGIGNKPIDGGFYLFKDEEKDAFVKKEPESEKYFKRWYGSDEFINRRPRWCLWLGDANPVELIKLPECMQCIEAVRNYRLKSPSPGTIKLADKPTHFHVENMPKGNYIVIPQVSSQRRPYIPMGYMDDSVLCSDKVRILPNVSLYLFGVLESSVHMGWMRTISCRLKSDYSYTVYDIYNCFPWPSSTEEQKSKIEKTAQAILDAREVYPEATLADMYGNLFLFPELLKAHRANDAAVIEAYDFPKDATESEIVARLFKMYQKLTEK